jgi:hypothetical protein
MTLNLKRKARTSNFKIPNPKILGHWDFGFALDFDVWILMFGL